MAEIKSEISDKPSACTISFVILDDLKPLYPPVHKEVPKTKEAIKAFILEIANSFKKNFPSEDYKRDYDDKTYEKEKKNWKEKEKDKKYDPSGYFSDSSSEAFNSCDATVIATSLLKEEYWVRNRDNKYYVLAFALDYSTFYVHSKDYGPEILDWNKKPKEEEILDWNKKPKEEEILVKVISDPCRAFGRPEVRQVTNGKFKGPVIKDSLMLNPVIAAMAALRGVSYD
jgi:hypothetical protein